MMAVMQAKRIERSLWNLNALMSGSRDRRIEHLRFLWTRQLQTVSNEGGVALRQFNLRVTYVNALQVSGNFMHMDLYELDCSKSNRPTPHRSNR